MNKVWNLGSNEIERLFGLLSDLWRKEGFDIHVTPRQCMQLDDVNACYGLASVRAMGWRQCVLWVDVNACN